MPKYYILMGNIVLTNIFFISFIKAIRILSFLVTEDFFRSNSKYNNLMVRKVFYL